MGVMTKDFTCHLPIKTKKLLLKGNSFFVLIIIFGLHRDHLINSQFNVGGYFVHPTCSIIFNIIVIAIGT